MKTRCEWCGNDPLYVSYHDEEWGVPVHDERRLFEFLVLEGAQAGLSWLTILKKRDAYRQAFDGFDVERIARYGRADVHRLLQNPGIVRNRLKIEATLQNARAVLALRESHTSLNDFLWRYVDGIPVQHRRRCLADLPAQTPTSILMSKDLLRHGFRFVGPTICYSLMQAVGLVNDHVVQCFRHREIAKNNAASNRPPTRVKASPPPCDRI
jgi:DNA-3-methyladenine glycosylase I